MSTIIFVGRQLTTGKSLASTLLGSGLDFLDSLAEALDFLHLLLRGFLVADWRARRASSLLYFLLQLMHFLRNFSCSLRFCSVPSAFFVCLAMSRRGRLTGLATLASVWPDCPPCLPVSARTAP